MSLVYSWLQYALVGALLTLTLGCAAVDGTSSEISSVKSSNVSSRFSSASSEAAVSSSSSVSSSVAASSSAAVSSQKPYVDIIHQPADGKIDISIGGQYFTSYLYDHPLLNKAVLFPVISASGLTVTRGYPLDTREGESTDHTHQHGVWFNHGDVNGVDFWNAGRTPPVAGVHYGHIDHDRILEMHSGDSGSFSVLKNWFDDVGNLMLQESATYEFEGDINTRIVTVTTTLTATDQDIHFKDSKEALFAIRVASELEIRDDQAIYVNSEGVEGYPAVWGKRASWMQLKGTIQDTAISLVIFDSPTNINYPAHWMARDYGLFAVDNLGNSAFGDDALNYVLRKNSSQAFKYQLVIADGMELSRDRISQMYQAFTGQSN